jgi:hypothetical protein
MNVVKAHLAAHRHVQIQLAATAAHADQALLYQQAMNMDVKASSKLKIFNLLNNGTIGSF